jgi:phage gp36-like protein
VIRRLKALELTAKLHQVSFSAKGLFDDHRARYAALADGQRAIDARGNVRYRLAYASYAPILQRRRGASAPLSPCRSRCRGVRHATPSLPT